MHIIVTKNKVGYKQGIMEKKDIQTIIVLHETIGVN